MQLLTFPRQILLFVVLVAQICGFIIFARGFFPKKLILPGFGQYYPDADHSHFPQPEFKRLIFMVVDAMRSDFMFGPSSHMSELHALISDGYGIPFTAFSTPPTVTLPRIKGLTTGSTPNFLDAVLNIAESDTSSTLLGQDSWLYQLKKQNRTIHMFGDDTWIKLFPDMFELSEGTGSFFVSDFTEVDNNVTRHLPEQLHKDSSWDVLILHYLGLDHIGHKGGPESHHMPGKQIEMDSIVSQIFRSLDEDTLLVVAGDHGMNEAGNHGGSSSGETSAGMAFLAKKFAKKLRPTIQKGQNYVLPGVFNSDYQYFNRIQQADLVPSLAALFDFPIPRNSLGVIPVALKDLWTTKEQQTTVLEQNARQIGFILEQTYEIPTDDTHLSITELRSMSSIDQVTHMWKHLQETNDFTDIEYIYEFLYECQTFLSKASSSYKEPDMMYGLLLEILAAVVSSACLLSIDFSKKLKFSVLLLCGIYCATMFGSSMVEEEHHFWYWGITGFLAWVYVLSARKGFKDSNTWIVCLALTRIIRAWNQAGQKYAGSPDVTRFLSSPKGGPILWVMIIGYYMFLLAKIWRGVSGLKLFTSFVTVVASLIFKTSAAIANGEWVPSALESVFKSDGNTADNLIKLAQLSFITIAGSLFYELTDLLLDREPGKKGKSFRSITKLSYIGELFLVTQTKTCNIPLFIFFNFLRSYLQTAISSSRVDSRDAVALLILFILLMQHVSYFAFGGSNSIASIDLSNAYNGVSTYNIALVGVLTYVSNWIGPLYWSMAGLSMLFESKVEGIQMINSKDILSVRLFLTQTFFSFAAVGIMGACIILKHHLFIWTVFSPKFLYATAWVILHNGLIDTIVTLIVVVALT